jgi:hypothetical protein
VAELLASFGINDCWCFVDRAGNWHGMQSKKVEALFRGADLYLDIGSHGT